MAGMVVKAFEPRDYSEFLDFVSQEPVNSRDSSQTNHEGAEWHGTATFGEAMVLAREGWRSGVDRVEAIYNRIYKTVGDKIKRTSFEYGVSGSVVDVGRFCAGEPECFMEFTDELVNGPGRVLTLMVNLACSAGISTDTIFLRGAAVMALVDSLESVGYSVAIEGRKHSSDSYGNGEKADFRFPIKRAGEAMESDRLAFIMCHNAFNRRLLFSATERIQRWREVIGCNTSSGYGRPLTGAQDVPPPGTAIYVCGLNSGSVSANFRSEADVTAWVLKTLAEQGVEMELK